MVITRDEWLSLLTFKKKTFIAKLIELNRAENEVFQVVKTTYNSPYEVSKLVDPGDIVSNSWDTRASRISCARGRKTATVYIMPVEVRIQFAM